MCLGSEGPSIAAVARGTLTPYLLYVSIHLYLEQEVEAYHGGLEGRLHEVERVSLERDAAQRAREEEQRQVERLQQTIAEQQVAWLTPTLTLSLTLTLTLP